MIWIMMPALAWLLTLFFAGLFGEVFPPFDKLIITEYLIILQVCYIVLIFVRIKKFFFPKKSVDSEG